MIRIHTEFNNICAWFVTDGWTDKVAPLNSGPKDWKPKIKKKITSDGWFHTRYQRSDIYDTHT